MNFQIPDWIEAAVGWRSWKVEMIELRSVANLHAPEWTPRQHKQAVCQTTNSYVWSNVEEGDPRPCWLKYLQDQGIQYCAGGRAIADYVKDYSGYCPPGKVRRLLPHDPAPCPNHECGIYAVTDLGQLTPYASYDRAIGTVSLWGKTTPGEKGYRAEYAYPKEIWIPAQPFDLDRRTRVAEILAEEYLVPVHVGLSEEIQGGVSHGKKPKIESLVAG